MRFEIPESLKSEIERIFKDASHKWTINDVLTVVRHAPIGKQKSPIWYVLTKGDPANMIIEFEERKQRFVFKATTNIIGARTPSHINGVRQYVGRPHLVLTPILENIKETLNEH